VKLTRLLSILVIVLILVVYAQEASFGQDVKVNKKVYMIIVNKLSLSDIEKMPNLKDLIGEGSLGLLNVRGLNGYNGAECFITINASNKAYASNISSQFYNLDGEYRETYENRVDSLIGEYQIGNIEIGRIYNQNEDNKYAPYIGALGDSLHRKGLKTAVFGNSDTDEEIVRYAPLIPMDSKGLIDFGNVDDVLIEDKDYPCGFKTDYEKILKEISEIDEKASLIVIDTGDLSRLSSYGNSLSDRAFSEKRHIILKDIDSFIGRLVGYIDYDNSLLMILSPNSPEDRIDESILSPIILWGKDVQRGTIISSTTKRAGIVTNTDIAPTIANFFDISLVKSSGNVIEYSSEDNIYEFINNINSRINLTSKVRSKTLTTYGIISVIIMLLVSAIVLLKLKIDSIMGKILEILLISIYALPLIFFVISIFNLNNMIKFILILVLFILLFISMSAKFERKRIIYILTFFYFIMIAIDIVLNGIFSKFSVLSHDPTIGARYFGIGNEMVGLFLAVTMLSIGLLWNKFRNKSLLILLTFASIILVGHPRLGANVGGLISFLSAGLYFVMEIFDKRINIRNLIIIGLSVVIIIAIFGFVDVKLNPNPTHLGRTLIQIGNGGLNIVENIIVRKLLMNIKLLGTSFWTKVLLCNVITHGILSILYNNLFHRILGTGLKKAYLSCIVGSIIGFIVNDSGLILSSIAMNMITIFYLFMVVNSGMVYSKQEVD